jgi:hypothetical protein
MFNGLDMLVSLLGVSSVFGLHHKPPKLGESAQAIVANDVRNYIVNCKMSYDSMCKLSVTHDLVQTISGTTFPEWNTNELGLIVHLSCILQRMRPVNKDIKTSSALDSEDDVLIDTGLSCYQIGIWSM